MAHPRRLLVLASLLVFAACPLDAQAKSEKDKDKDAPPKVAAPGATPEVGEIIADYTFKNFISGDGRTSMKDFRGNVILVDWWGTH
jgi:hypothetical protein